MAFLEFAPIHWEATKPTIFLTDNKFVTRFSQTKTIPPAIWIACDYVLHFFFQKSTQCWFSQHCGWLSLQTGTQCHGEDTSQNLQHATLKNTQTIGLLKWSHVSVKQPLKIETVERRSLWHKYVNIAVLNYNTSYHTTIGCEPSRDCHGHFLHKRLDLKMGITHNKHSFPLGKLPKMFSIKRRWYTRMLPEMPSKLISNIKIITTKTPTLQSSKKQNIYMSYSRKQIIKGVNFPLRCFGELTLTLLKKC